VGIRAAFVFLLGIAFCGSSCEILVKVDTDQLPLPVPRDSSTASDASDATDGAPVDLPADTGFDAAAETGASDESSQEDSSQDAANSDADSTTE
jgi:hypothetical protein